MKIYVGNISFQTSESELSDLFSSYGEVQSVNIVKDRISGRSKGFAFVEMEDNAAATAAIEALNGTDQKGRNITVNEARPREEGDRPRFNKFNRGGSGGGGDRNSGGGYNKRNNY